MPKKPKALIDTDDYTILQPPQNGVWYIRSERSNETYTVRTGEDLNTCSCPDFQHRGHQRACRHLMMVWSLESLCPWLNTGKEKKYAT